MIQVEVKGMELTMRNLQKLEQEGVRSMSRMIRGITIQAGASAAILSRPEANKSLKRIGKKKKLRKIVPIAGKKTTGVQKTWVYIKANNQRIVTTKKIPPKKARARGLVQAKQAVQYWDKKKNHWAFAPMNPRTKKPVGLRSGLKIPGFAAVKAGWLHAIRSTGKAGKENTLTPDVRSGKLGTGRITDSRGTLTNIVKYGSKIASSVPKQAEQKAWNWLKNDLWRKEKRKLEKIKL